MKCFGLFSAIIVLILLFLSCSNQPKIELTEKLKTSLRSDSKEFTGDLKSILIKELQTNGIVAAVSVCSDTAQILTNKFGTAKGIFIKRVSFKNRNPQNAPDEFETKVLKHFEELKSNGKLNDSTEFVEVVEINGIKNIRYLKPIIVQAPCLTCHGSKEFIMPDVKAIIEKRYPNDKAVGYNIDDLRGAVSIQKIL